MARFGSGIDGQQKNGRESKTALQQPGPVPPAGSIADTSLILPQPTALPTCLHDELLIPHPKPRTPPSSHAEPLSTPQIPRVSASRPCYRCVEMMNSVGIKRVFWTNDTGKWEGGKVRDLLLESSGTGEGADEAQKFFVTKHALLMLRRTMT